MQFCPVEISFVEREQLLSQLNTTQNNLLILSKSAEKRWNLTDEIARLTKESASNNKCLARISDSLDYPTVTFVAKKLNEFKDWNFTTIFAIGGGSAIDLAKILSALKPLAGHATVDNVKDFVASASYNTTEATPIYAAPSTSGTGSEITQWATIWDDTTNTKYSIDNPQYRPQKAFLCPELTLSLPHRTTLSTGLDALAQAIEAYWSVHTTPIVQAVAYQATKTMMEWLPRVLKTPSDIEARKHVMIASCLSGIAFSNTRTTACHSISYPITSFFGVEHGLAVALTLAPIAQFNRGFFDDTRGLYALFEQHGGLAHWLDNTAKPFTLRLTSFGIDESGIETIVDNGYTPNRMGNNPRKISREQLTKLLREIL